jgi:hypothetical protein
MPLWAFRQLEDLRITRQFVNWWIDNRQVPYGDFGGGISDDTDLTQQWPGLALMGVDPDKINASLRALSEAVYTNGMMINGLGHITTDELHAYEEGMNSDAERLYLNWGEPRAVERLMATVKALKGVLLPNAAGHMHFATNWYGAQKMYREGPFEWQKPYSFVVLHAPTLIGLYNGNPDARGLITGVIDGWMAHGKQDAKGNWTYPNEINWRSDAERAEVPGPDQVAHLQEQHQVAGTCTPRATGGRTAWSCRQRHPAALAAGRHRQQAQPDDAGPHGLAGGSRTAPRATDVAVLVKGADPRPAFKVVAYNTDRQAGGRRP